MRQLNRFLKHPMLYARTLYRERGSSEGSIAVIVPAKNRAAYLEDAVESAIYQTRPPKEVYIILEPSTDGTELVAESLAQQFGEVRCIVNETDRGVAQLRNQGIGAAASDYLMFLDSDDVLNPWYFEKVAALLDQDAHVGVAYSDYLEFGERSRVISLPPFDPRILLVDCIIMGCAMARRRALEDAGGYDPNQIFEDWELWIRLIGKGWNAKGVRAPLYNYRVHSGTKDSLSNLRRVEGEHLIYMKHRGLYDKYGISRTSDGKWVNPPSYTLFR